MLLITWSRRTNRASSFRKYFSPYQPSIRFIFIYMLLVHFVNNVYHETLIGTIVLASMPQREWEIHHLPLSISIRSDDARVKFKWLRLSTNKFSQFGHLLCLQIGDIDQPASTFSPWNYHFKGWRLWMKVVFLWISSRSLLLHFNIPKQYVRTG